MNWNTPLFIIEEDTIIQVPLSDWKTSAMLPREHGTDFRYFADKDSDGLWWVKKVPVQGARAIRISHHETEEEAQMCAQNYCLTMAYEKAIEEGAFESEWDAEEFMRENGMFPVYGNEF